MKESRAQGFWAAVLVSWFLWSTLLVLDTSNLYLSNVGDFTLRLRDLLAFSLPLFGVVTIGSTALLLLFKLPVRRRLVAVLFALAALVWFQGNVLVWRYGLLDGKPIVWSDHWRKGVVDGLIWLTVLAWSLIRPGPFYRAAPIASAVLIVLPLVATVVTTPPMPKRDAHSLRHFAIDESAKYTFSRKRNVILIVLDEFQSDVFQEIVEGDENYSAIFDGFTYFRDTLAGSNYTELAIPALLTGRIYDNSQTRSRFLERAYLDDSVMAVLKRHGYVVDIFPWVGWGNESIFFDDRIASNLKRVETRGADSTYTEKNVREVLHLIDLSLFRSAPHFLKRYIYNDQRWLLPDLAGRSAPRWLKETVSTDARFEAGTFASEVSPRIEATRTEPVFKYYHLKGAHTPYTVNEDLEFTNQVFPRNRLNYTAQAKACLRSLGVFFAELKRLAIFDQSLIIVAGDHGSGDSEEMFVGKPQDAVAEGQGRGLGSRRGFERDKARGLPVLLVKRFGSEGRLETSEAPVSLLDVPATIFSELGLEANPTGVSVYEVGSDVVRPRRYGAFEMRKTKSDYVSPIVLYSVDGDSWLDDSWSIEGIHRPPSQEQMVPAGDRSDEGSRRRSSTTSSSTPE